MKKYTDQCFKYYTHLAYQVKNEHERQTQKWGIQSRTAFEWLTYATEELGELAKAIGEHEYRGGSRYDVIEEAIQTATLALKIAEMFEWGNE